MQLLLAGQVWLYFSDVLGESSAAVSISGTRAGSSSCRSELPGFREE